MSGKQPLLDAARVSSSYDATDNDVAATAETEMMRTIATVNGIDPHATNTAVSVHFRDLDYALPGGRQILHKCTGSIVPGRLMGILGPSGAGKSCLLSCLMSKLQPTGGTVLVNGRQDSMSKYRKVVGYVWQHWMVDKHNAIRTC